MSVRTSPGLMKKTGIRPASSNGRGECLPVAADRRLARRVGGVCRGGRGGRCGQRAPRDHDPARPAVEHVRDNSAAAKVDAEDVDLETCEDSPGRPPRSGACLRSTPALATSRSSLLLGDGVLDRLAVVTSICTIAADLLRDRLDLSRVRAATITSQPSPASARAIPAPMPRPPPVTNALIPAQPTATPHSHANQRTAAASTWSK